ncbi:MAG: cupin domain-containing protein [Gammaproteobacteria bacterium]
MHTTDTLDFVVMLSSEVWLELDDGAERCVRAGDCVVQNGTRHRWQNRSDRPCVMAAVMVGATRAG